MRAVTTAVAIITAAWVNASRPIPRILPNINWRAVTVDSSTSTTRDDFSLVTPVTTHPP